jgi:hypothetical protein
MKVEEIILCNDKKILIDYIKNNSEIKVYDSFDLSLLKTIALDVSSKERIMSYIKKEEEKNLKNEK